MSVYFGIALIAFSMLALEVALSRLLSIITWYHLAFFAVSTAMLGMTAAAVRVFRRPGSSDANQLHIRMATASLWYAISIPVTLIILCNLPWQVVDSIKTLAPLLTITLACALPFYFSGIVLTLALTKYPLPVGRIYGSDLLGAALGCLFALGGMELFDVPTLILICGSLGGLAAWILGKRSLSLARRIAVWVSFLGLALFASWNASSPYKIRPPILKGDPRYALNRLWEKWNSFSYVIISRGKLTPEYWGPSRRAPRDEKIFQFRMNIDGGAGTTLRRFRSLQDIDHLRYDVTNIGYYLRPNGGACIIGYGGGRDLHSAILFGHQTVTGIDVNPIFAELLTKEFRKFAGIADRPGVHLYVEEARSFLSRSKDKFSIIQMSLIDTWASTSAGAFSLSENGLYTTEAWQLFLERLKPNGIFTVSRWYASNDLGETGRMVSLAVHSLLRSGIKDPSRHIALICSKQVATLLMSRDPFTQADISTLQNTTSYLKFKPAILPGVAPDHRQLRRIVSARNMKEFDRSIQNDFFNYEPPTDENPYFFIMLRLANLNRIPETRHGLPVQGVIRGNLLATQTLLWLIICLIMLTVLTIVLPLLVKPKGNVEMTNHYKIHWAAALYFSLIGAGFMLAEIGLIQRLSVFLGHPVYALGILLFTIIASTGIGSFLSARLPLTRPPLLWIYPIAAGVAMLAVRLELSVLGKAMVASAIPSKVLASVLVISPLGILLGFFFPTGMSLARSLSSTEPPWYWALNGTWGILFSALAVFFAIYSGITTNFYLAAIFYFLTFFCVRRMRKTIPVFSPEKELVQVS